MSADAVQPYCTWISGFTESVCESKGSNEAKLRSPFNRKKNAVTKNIWYRIGRHNRLSVTIKHSEQRRNEQDVCDRILRLLWRACSGNGPKDHGLLVAE